MGFGLLLFGFSFLLDYGILLNNDYGIGFDIYPDLAGFILMFIALRKLSPYGRGFRYAQYFCYPLFAVGGALIALPLLSLAGAHLSLIKTAIDYVYFARDLLTALLCIMLFAGIRELSLDVELPKIARRSVIAFVLVMLFFIPRSALELISFTDAQRSFLILWYQLFWYICLFFILFLCFNCYMYICYEGEEDPEIKESKILKFLNKLHNK